MTKTVKKQQPATRTRRDASADMPGRTKLMAALREHIQKHIGGTQADKAKALGITQPRLNDLLKDRIDKFSLDALVSLAKKAGLRVSIHVQAVQLHSESASINLNLAPVHSIFAPTPSQLGQLGSQEGPNLFLRLLRCEAIANGLSPKDVVLSSNINAPDSGIDAKVENSPISGFLLAKGSTYYQIKTGPAFKPWQPSALKKELLGKSGAFPSKQRLGSEVRTCLEQDGTYVLVTFGHDLLPIQHSQAATHLADLFKECGYTNPKVRVYGQGQLVGELDKYPSLCCDLVGLDDGGFLPIKGWRNNAQMQGVLELGNEQAELIKEIRTALQENTVQHIRIIGEPGIGKTRLALEALDVDEIGPSVIYVSAGEDFQTSKLFNELLKPDRTYSVTLVIDDCDNRDRVSIWSALKGRSGINLITIDHGPDNTHDSAMRIYHCPQLPEEQIKNILFSYLQEQTDLSNWAKWCGGSPRVAHLLGENLKSNPDDLLKAPADVDVWDRYIIGHKEMASNEAAQHRIVLRHIALFQRFGFEVPVDAEAEFISDLVKQVDPMITWGRFQVIVQYYRDKRILQGRHTLFIVPKMLHVHLWVQFWKNHGHGFQFQHFLGLVPKSVKRWFLELFIYAQEAPQAKKVVKNILSTTGPFSDQSFLKSEVGLRFLNYLSEADPRATVALLERTIKTWSQEELYAWNTGCQDIVWALEKIAVWDDLFARAVSVLIPMALAENAGYSNNSKELLLSLFQVRPGWAPTQAPPSKRFSILRDLVMSDDASRRSLGLEMCKEWLKTHGGYRMIGAEYQGLKPAIEFWRPKTYGELFDYWRQVLQFLRAEMKGFDADDRNRVAEIFVGAASGFVDDKAMVGEVMDILFELADDKEINRRLLIQFVIRQLHRNSASLDKKTLTRIRQLDSVLTGSSLWERTRRYILFANWQEDRTFRGKEYKQTRLLDKRVQDLAKEYMTDHAIFSEYLPRLVKANEYKLWALGEECGKLAEDKFDEAIINYIEVGNPINNGRFLGGYLASIHAHNIIRYENLIRRLLQNKTTRKISVDCISKLTEPIIRDMLTLFEDGELESEAFKGFAFTQKTASLSDDLFQQLITSLLRRADETSINVCIQHVHNYYFGENATGDFPEDLIFKVLSTVRSDNNQDQMYGYYWDITAREFLKEHPDRKMELFNTIMRDMGSIFRYGNTGEIANLADDIVKEQPYDTWKIVSELLTSEEYESYNLIYWLSDTGFDDKSKHGAICYMPAEDIIDWINSDIENRLRLIQEVLPKTLDENAGGQLTRLFIEEFCDDDRIAGSLCGHFHMGGWTGPDSIYLSKKRDAARRWMSEIPSPGIQLWLGKYIDYLSGRIEAAIIQEEREF